MYYIYLDSSGKKMISKSSVQIANLLNVTANTILNRLRTGIYIKNGITLLKFQEHELIKTVRNRRGNPFYQKLSEMKGMKLNQDDE